MIKPSVQMDFALCRLAPGKIPVQICDSYHAFQFRKISVAPL